MLRRLFAVRVRVVIGQLDHIHDKPGHTERTLETLEVNNGLLDRMKRAISTLQPFDRHHLTTAHLMGQG